MEDMETQKVLCIAMYEKEMRPALKTADNEVQLIAMHMKAKEKVVASFRNSTKTRDKSIWTPYYEQLLEGIKSSYNDIFEFRSLKWASQRQAVEKIIGDAKEFYDKEIVTRFPPNGFMDTTKLCEMHESIKKMTLIYIVNSVRKTLTDETKKDISNALDAAFKKYEEKNFMNRPIDPAIGIDLGTTYSCVAVFNRANGQVEVITNNDSGQKTTPSYVAYKNGLATVGDAAKEQAPDNPESTVFDAKRMIGRKFDDESLRKDMLLWPFKTVEENESPKIEIEGKTYYPEEISAKVLGEMKRVAEMYLGCEVKKAVITVPAYFNDSQRQATIDAGEIAGLKVLRIINEPTAAAIAYNIQHSDKAMRKVLIFDLGGGTFDVAVLEMKKGDVEVKSVDGDTHLGGEDFDANLSEYCAAEFKKQHGIDLFEGRNSTNANKRATTSRLLTRLKYACERSKKIISTNQSGEDLVRIDCIVDGIDLKVQITKEIFETINKQLFEKTVKIVDRALNTVGIPKSAIDDIVLVGGSTRIPKVQALLSEHFGGKALTHKINPDEAVAFGAAYQAAIMNGQITKDSVHYTNSTDVTPFSIGIELVDLKFSVIIPQNTKIPVVSKRDDYRTPLDDQTSVGINVFQGEDTVASRNTKLGNFVLTGIPPAEKGKEKLSVEMIIDEQGVLTVTATCVSNGVSNSGLTVNVQKWRLSKGTIQRLKLEIQKGLYVRYPRDRARFGTV